MGYYKIGEARKSFFRVGNNYLFQYNASDTET